MTIHRQLDGLGYVPPFAGSKHFGTPNPESESSSCDRRLPWRRQAEAIACPDPARSASRSTGFAASDWHAGRAEAGVWDSPGSAERPRRRAGVDPAAPTDGRFGDSSPFGSRYFRELWQAIRTLRSDRRLCRIYGVASRLVSLQGHRHDTPRPPRRHHPHLPEVRPRRVPQPDRAAAGPGVAGVRAPARLRQHARADRGGTGPRRPHRPAARSRGLGPSLDALMEMLEERKRKILETYETDTVQRRGRGSTFHDQAAADAAAAEARASDFQQAVREEQLHDLERLWYRAGDERGEVRPPARCSSSNGSATSIRSTSWPRSTSSPAASR